ncbi:para-aminobenzoate synthase, (PABA) [Cryptotrichosporon argae]
MVPPLPRTVILDYYDSYTNNLLILFAQLYTDAEVLSKVVVTQHDKYSWQDFQDVVLPHVDCVILSPGPGRPDNPADIGFALDLLRLHPVPILGICLGHQAIAVAFGGKIINTPRIAHGHVVSVTPVPSAALFAPWASGVFDAVVYNSLTVDEPMLPAELEVTAYTDKGGRAIMGLAHRTHAIWGVQYHPESISSTHGADTILAFLGAVNARHAAHEYACLPAHVQRACAFRVSSPAPAVAPSRPQEAGPSSGGGFELAQRRFGPVGRDVETPAVFERVVRGQPLGSIWLDGQTPTKPTTTTLAAPVFVLTYSLASRTVRLHLAGSQRVLRLPPTLSFFDWLDEGMSELSAFMVAPARMTASKQAFKGGLVGWFTYEMKAESLAGYTGRDAVERTDAVWAYVDRFVERAEDGEWAACAVLGHVPPRPRSAMVRWLAEHVSLGAARDEFEAYANGVERVLRRQGEVREPVAPASAFPRFRPAIPAEAHRQRIDACRESIRQGESYELNQTTAFVASLPPADIALATDTSDADRTGDAAGADKTTDWDRAYALYLRLRTFNPAYYSAFLSFPSIEATPSPSVYPRPASDSAGDSPAAGPSRPRGIHVLSSSPERFLSISDGRIEMRPIKGTRRRVRVGECVCRAPSGISGGTGCRTMDPGSAACRAEAAREDVRRGEELVGDVKERAENLMIVDLIRADLLACCVPSSVAVPQLIALESYGVHNLVTTVRGVLRDGVGAVQAVKRCFPPGSMTGAPKLKSVQLLEQTEKRRPRGVYSGALGYFSLDGAADLSVVIRTIVAEGDQLSIGAGGAITWMSDRQGEWDEVLTKVQSVVGKLESVE